MMLRWIVLIYMILLPVKAAHIELTCLEAGNLRHYVVQVQGTVFSTSPFLSYIAHHLLLDWNNCLSARLVESDILRELLDARFRYQIGLINWPSHYGARLDQVLNRFEAWESRLVLYEPPIAEQLLIYFERLSECVPFWKAHASEIERGQEENLRWLRFGTVLMLLILSLLVV